MEERKRDGRGGKGGEEGEEKDRPGKTLPHLLTGRARLGEENPIQSVERREQAAGFSIMDLEMNQI